MGRRLSKMDFYGVSVRPWFGFHLSHGSGFRVLNRQVIVAPSVITFYEDRYTEFSDFIKRISEAAALGPILIDLRGVREVKAAGMLVLYATIQTLQKKYDNRRVVRFTKCRYRSIGISFGRMGFWSLSGQAGTMPTYLPPNSLEICMASYEATGRNNKAQLKRVLQYTQEAIEDAGLDEENVLAYNAITESVSNVWQHAYDKDFLGEDYDYSLANWWIIVERIEDQFFIAVYDMGVGIPTTLEKKPWYAVYFINSDGEMFEYAADAHRIKMAVEYGRSRFKVDNRGKGLSEAKDFVLSNPMGTMIIYSGRGSYVFRTATGKDDLKSLPSEFPGTLIQWNLQLEFKK